MENGLDTAAADGACATFGERDIEWQLLRPGRQASRQQAGRLAEVAHEYYPNYDANGERASEEEEEGDIDTFLRVAFKIQI